MVVLTTCRGAQRGPPRWRGLTAALLRAGVPVVVGMQYAVSAEAAEAFSVGFYRALARGASIDFAVANGRCALIEKEKAKAKAKGIGFDDFGVPVVYSRVPRPVDLRIEEIEEDDVVLPGEARFVNNWPGFKAGEPNA